MKENNPHQSSSLFVVVIHAPSDITFIFVLQESSRFLDTILKAVLCAPLVLVYDRCTAFCLFGFLLQQLGLGDVHSVIGFLAFTVLSGPRGASPRQGVSETC